MRDSALYFPYIQVPNSRWFSRVLLYWDTVSSIVPSAYAQEPGNHTPYMHELVTAGLVTQLFPAQYVYQIPNFSEPFLGYVKRRLLSNLQMRWPQKAPRTRVHAEKTGDIGQELVRLRVASKVEAGWYEMDQWVARAFMTYLATTLGELKEVKAAPVTQDATCFKLLSGPVVRNNQLYSGGRYLSPRRRYARAVVLQEIFPEPARPADIKQLVEFKARHGDKLRRLRRAVERKCTELASEEDSEVRRERAQNIRGSLEDEINEVTDALRITWKEVLFGSVCSVIGAVGGVAAAPPDQRLAMGAVSGLAAAVYSAFDPFRRRNNALKRPFAYAALANARFRAV